VKSNTKIKSGIDGLYDTQHWMQRALMFPRQVDLTDVTQKVLASPTLSPDQCLAVYQHSYYSRLLACLKEQFPALCYCLGEEVFNALAQEYLFEFPSDSYTLHALGRRFSSFLHKTRPDREKPELWVNFMLDLATFEYLAYSMFDAEGDEGRILGSTTEVHDCELHIQRCVQVHKAGFPVADYYCAVRDGKKPTLPDCRVSITAMVRKDYKTRLVALNSMQLSLLTNLISQKNVSLAIEKTADSHKGLTQQEITRLWHEPNGVRAQWLRLGFFIRKS
jgi:hypothetical protein